MEELVRSSCADESSQVNSLDVVNNQAGVNAAWLLGRHRVFSGPRSRTANSKHFSAKRLGQLHFASIAAYETGRPSTYTYQYMLQGGVRRSLGVFGGSVFLAGHLDGYARLTLMAVYVSIIPGRIPNHIGMDLVEETLAGETIAQSNGAYVLGPRGSFTYKFGRKGSHALARWCWRFFRSCPWRLVVERLFERWIPSAVNTTVSVLARS